MKQINNLDEFKAFYPYKSPPNDAPCPPKSKRPRRYPCFCEVMHENAGICGEYIWVRIVYPPDWADLASFRAGLEAA